MTSSAKTLRALRQFVYVVTYAYDYEGESVEAAYASRKDAEKHPNGGDEMRIHKLYVHAIALKRKRTGRR